MDGLLHITNARIWTGSPNHPWARSVTARAGRIVAVNDPADDKFDGVILDAAGRTVLPGLIDAHMHLLAGGRSLDELDLSHVRSREAFESAIADRHAQLPAGEWLIARGWSNENWPGSANPDKSWLAAAGDRPVVCHRMDLHAVVVNDAVLAQCDLSCDPAGGRIGREPSTGEPTGLMVEAAAWKLVNPLAPRADVSMRRRYLRDAQAFCHRHGVTALNSMEYTRDLRDVFEPLRHELTMRCHLTLLDRDWPVDIAPGRDFDNDEHLAVIGYKAFLDGTLGSRTARMLQPYADDPDNCGMFVELAAEGQLFDWAHRVADAGLSPSMHAIGDEAVRLALDVIDRIDERSQPRVEHVQQIGPADIPRCRDRIMSMQPLHKADDGRYAERCLGRERMSCFFAFRSLREAGAHLAFGSDWPVVSPDPIAGMRAAVTGLTFDNQPCATGQNLTVEEALRAYTVDAAKAIQLHDGGTIQPGAHADFVMLDRDPFTCDWVESPPRVMMTIANGEVVHDGR